MTGSARNTADRFGWVTRMLHWAMAAGILAQLALGATIVRMEVGLSNFWLFGLHKSIGLTLLALGASRLIWHVVSPPPPPLPAENWKTRLARLTHRSFYVLFVLVPITGWIGSSATGIDTVLFDTVTAPRIAPVSEAWQSAGFAAHAILTKLLAALAALHIAGALTRRDGTLRRMTVGSF